MGVCVQESYCLLPLEMSFPGGSVVKNPPGMQEPWVDPWVRKVPWKKAWQPTLVFLLRKSHGHRSLAGYSPWGWKGSNMTESTEHIRTTRKKYIYRYTNKVNESCSVVSDSLWLHGLYSPWNSPGQNTDVGNLSLLQGIFLNQEPNGVSCLAGRFFTNWAIREALSVQQKFG